MRAAHATVRTFARPAPRPVEIQAAAPAPGHVVLRACRPRQWLKNALVAIAPGAAGVLTHPHVIMQVVGAFVAFCLLSSATYLVNDVRDRKQDRRHPRKRFRPIAAGQLRPRGAIRLAALMAIAGLGLATAIRPVLGLVGGGYLALTTTYSIWWRRIVVVDLAAVSAGFVLRAVGGAAAADVRLSRAFIIVISACAMFIVAGKRYAELGAPHPSRATLRRYSRGGLKLLLASAALVACVAYAWWAFSRAPRALSIVPFVLWLGRYRGLIGAGAGEAPEEIVVRDPGLVAFGLAWAALFAAEVYA
jgi:decaprenyl-phosphate phosphoribosyltransferase